MGTGSERRSFFIIVLLFLGVVLSGCTQWFSRAGENAGLGEIVQSGKARVTSPDIAAGELAELVAGDRTFAFDLYQAVRESEGNLFYSPYSVSTALAMIYAGARGTTATQMEETLHFTLGQERLHPAVNALALALKSRADLPEGWDGEGFALNIANSIWGQTGYRFLTPFLDVLAENYGAGLRLLDFATASDASRTVINDWVSDQTGGRIQELFPQGSVTPDTRLVLANAIYFNAPWLCPFLEENTKDGTFYLLDGGEVTVPMMEQENDFFYLEGPGYHAVELLYNGAELSLVLVMPKGNSFKTFEAALTAEGFASLVSELRSAPVPIHVYLTMPKFTYETELSLAGILSAMGMPDAFNPSAADFSGMDGSQTLFLSEVYHKAFVAVDEEGTEAAAATGGVMTTGIPVTTVEFAVDRPFLFLIRDVETGAIVFMGRVVNPSE